MLPGGRLAVGGGMGSATERVGNLSLMIDLFQSKLLQWLWSWGREAAVIGYPQA